MICERCKNVADGKTAVVLNAEAAPETNRHLCTEKGCTCQHRERK